MYHTGARIRKDSDFRELFQVGTEGIALQNEIGELALPNNLDQPGGLQFFKVVRECGSAYAVELMKFRARHVRLTRANLFQHLIASRLGQRTRDTRKLPIGKPGAVGVCHSSQGSLIGFECPITISPRDPHTRRGMSGCRAGADAWPCRGAAAECG